MLKLERISRAQRADKTYGPTEVTSYIVQDPVHAIQALEENNDSGQWFGDDPRPKTIIHYYNGSLVTVLGSPKQIADKIQRYKRDNDMGLKSMS